MSAPPAVRIASGWLARLQQLPDRYLFGTRSQGSGAPARVRRALRYVYALTRDLIGGQLSLRATGLVYATLLAIVPLLAFSFGILRAFNAQNVLQPLVQQFFAPMGAAGDDVTAQVMGYANKVGGKLVGTVGLALLIWTLIGTLKRVEDGFNFTWHVNEPRSLARRLTEYLAFLIIGPVLLGAVIGLSQLAQASVPLRLLAELAWLDRFRAVALSVAPYVVICALMTLLYKIIPNTRVYWRPALIGGVVAGVLWAAVGRVLTVLVISSTRLTAVYAGLAILIAALIWTYLNWIILLLGSRVAFYAQNPSYLRLGLGDLQLSSIDTERIALAVMYCVGERHLAGGARLSVPDLATLLGYPGVAVSTLSEALEQAELLACAEDETLLPARDLSQIRVGEILEVARRRSRGLMDTPSALPSAVLTLHSQMEQAWRQQCGQLTLAELITAPPSPAGDGHGLEQ